MTSKEKNPGYRELKVKGVRNNGSKGIEIDFSNCKVSFPILLRDVKKYGLKNLSAGDTIFAKSKLGTKDEDFGGGGLIEDIKFQKS